MITNKQLFAYISSKEIEKEINNKHLKYYYEEVKTFIYSTTIIVLRGNGNCPRL